MDKFLPHFLFFSTLAVHEVTWAKEKMLPEKETRKATLCVPCEGGVGSLNKEQIDEYLGDFLEWKLRENPNRIERIFSFNTFPDAIKFVNKIAKIAESQGHHPDILIVYSKVTIQLFTHAIHGLSVNDFILAGLIDELYQKMKP